MNEDINVDSQEESTVETTTEVSEAENKSAENVNTTSEKTQKPVETDEGVEGSSTRVPQTVPYERLAEVIKERNQLREKALLFDRIQQDPELAQAVLRNVNFDEPDPVTQEADKKLREMGYVRSTDVEQMISQAIERHEFIREFGSKVTSLAEKYNGSDGLPKFVPEEIVSFMDEKGIKDPELAYEVKFKEELAEARAKAKRGTAYSEKPGKPMQSADISDYDKLIKEAKETRDWSKVFRLKV